MRAGKFLLKAKLITVFRQFKSNPKKIFIAKDFDPPSRNNRVFETRYLDTLMRLNLIEKLEIISPPHFGATNGYRLKT